jgi:diguanylate cyclase (GGDEF)-like protein/PAS domain S-box-containing protein
MRTVAQPETLMGERPATRWTGRGLLALPIVLFAAVLALRLAISGSAAAVLVLFVLPVALVAMSFGRWAGLGAATVAATLAAVYEDVGGDDGGPAGFAARAAPVAVLGFLLGWFADRLAVAQEGQAGARQALQQARDELEEAQRVAGVGSWRWDVASDRLTWSAELQRGLALASDEVTTLEDLLAARLHPDDVASAIEARDRGLHDRQPFELRQRLVLPDGGTRHVLIRAEVLVDHDVVTGLRGTAQDVTQLREAEFAAQAARDRLIRVLETLMDAVVVNAAVRDSDGAVVDFRVEYANPAAVRTLNYPTEEARRRLWSELWPHRPDTELFAAYVRLVETGEPLVVAGARNLDHTPGTAEFVDLRAARLGDGCVTIARDVTERVRADRALAEATAQFAAAFDHAPVGMALIRSDGVLLRVNEALGAITGHAMDALVGSPLTEFVDPRDVDSSRVQLAELVGGVPGSASRAEFRLRTVGGEARWVCLSMALVGTGEVTYAVAHVEDIHDRKRLEGRMQYLADHDALTGLYNRRRFHEELVHHQALAARYGGGGVVALVDLDNFKYINDTLGHQSGDQLIQAIGRMLRSRLRDSDVIGRLGGDEFAVLLPEADMEHATEVTASLLAGIRSTEIEEAGHRVRSTGSAGLARLDEPGVVGADAVLANADLAMYAAKDAGRDTLVVHDPGGPHVAQSAARFRWLDRIRQALEHDLFVLRAQPILALASGDINGCEILVRMRHGGQLIEPDRFLPIAERHGMAAAIDRVVVARSIDLVATQPRPAGFRWEINLSADSLGDPALPQLIEAKLEETGIAPSSLVFEITETAAITQMDQARAFAARISELGCGFALDDFGAGYGSFYYLKHLPFDYLKIDGEFIRQLATSQVDQTIVRAIVAAAHPLGKQTIAEYVGDAVTLELLRELGVDHAQGYYIGQPVDPTQPLPTWEQRTAKE